MNEELAYTVYQIDQNIGLVSELMEKDKEYTKEGGVKLNCLESLKAKLAVTTGDVRWSCRASREN
jgi:hypothetical protein